MLRTSLITFRIRSSNSPLYLLPATIPDRSRTTTLLFLTESGTIPEIILCARPSTIAVLPTPGSPTRHGLFLVLLLNIWIRRAISFSLPTTGSSFPSAAIAVRSRLYWSSVGVVEFLFSFCFFCICSSSNVELESISAAERTVLYSFWIFTPIVYNSLVPTQSVSRSIARSRCSVPACSSFCFSASFTACSLIFWALGL